MTLITALNKSIKKNMRFRFANGMRLEITRFLTLLLFTTLVFDGVIFRFLVLAIISEPIQQAAVKYARIANGKAPSNFFSDPM